jgi:hypothetical protein
VLTPHLPAELVTEVVQPQQVSKIGSLRDGPPRQPDRGGAQFDRAQRQSETKNRQQRTCLLFGADNGAREAVRPYGQSRLGRDEPFGPLACEPRQPRK